MYSKRARAPCKSEPLLRDFCQRCQEFSWRRKIRRFETAERTRDWTSKCELLSCIFRRLASWIALEATREGTSLTRMTQESCNPDTLKLHPPWRQMCLLVIACSLFTHEDIMSVFALYFNGFKTNTGTCLRKGKMKHNYKTQTDSFILSFIPTCFFSCLCSFPGSPKNELLSSLQHLHLEE